MRTETKLLPDSPKGNAGSYLRRRPTVRLFCLIFLRQREKVEETAFHNLEDGVGSRARGDSALSQPSPSPSERSFVSDADVLHSCSHGSERTISECEGGSEKKAHRDTVTAVSVASLSDYRQTNILSVLSGACVEARAKTSTDWCR